METIKEDIKFDAGDIVMVGAASPAKYIAGNRSMYEPSQVELYDLAGDYVTTVNVSRLTRNITAETGVAVDIMCAI